MICESTYKYKEQLFCCWEKFSILVLMAHSRQAIVLLLWRGNIKGKGSYSPYSSTKVFLKVIIVWKQNLTGLEDALFLTQDLQ